MAKDRNTRGAHVRDELIWSFVATLMLTGIMRGSQETGVTRMDIPLMLGTIVTADRDRAKFWGFILHMVNGLLFGVVYAAVFHSWRRASPLLGALIGFFHGLLVLATAIPLLPGLHPRMASSFTGPQPTTGLEPPGFLGMNYGRRTPVITVLAHMVYGAIIGQFYEVRPEPPPSLLGRDHSMIAEDVAALSTRNR
jgi:hypothetical protein